METFRNLQSQLYQLLNSPSFIYRVVSVTYLGFLDILCRFSFSYIGWWSLFVTGLGLVTAEYIPLLGLHHLKTVFGIIFSILMIFISSLLILLFGTYVEQLPTFPVMLYVLHAHVQLILGIVTCYVASINTPRKLLTYVYFLFMVNLILRVMPYWTFDIFIIITIFLLTLVTLDTFEHGFPFSLEDVISVVGEENFRRLMHLAETDFFKAFWRIIDEIIDQRTRHIYVTHHIDRIYFVVLAFTTFLYNTTVGNHDIKWTVFSTLGACCCNLISVRAFIEAFLVVTIFFVKCSAVSIKGFDEIEEPVQIVMSDTISYHKTVFLVTIDMIFYDMPPYERGLFLENRLWLLLAILVEACFKTVTIKSAETEVMQSNFQTSARVVVMHLIFLLFPLFVIYWLINVYSTLEFSILLTQSYCFIIALRAVTSLFLFVLHKWDSMRQDFWEHFDDAVFYAHATLASLSMLINSITVCCGVFALLFSFVSWLEITRLAVLCYLSIYKVIVRWKNIIRHRKRILQFTAMLDDASGDQISQRDDVCPVCHQEIESAKVTPCDHLFHEICLRKWLISRTTCPLCSQVIVQQET